MNNGYEGCAADMYLWDFAQTSWSAYVFNLIKIIVLSLLIITERGKFVEKNKCNFSLNDFDALVSK